MHKEIEWERDKVWRSMMCTLEYYFSVFCVELSLLQLIHKHEQFLLISFLLTLFFCIALVCRCRHRNSCQRSAVSFFYENIDTLKSFLISFFFFWLIKSLTFQARIDTIVQIVIFEPLEARPNIKYIRLQIGSWKPKQKWSFLFFFCHHQIRNDFATNLFLSWFPQEKDAFYNRKNCTFVVKLLSFSIFYNIQLRRYKLWSITIS